MTGLPDQSQTDDTRFIQSVAENLGPHIIDLLNAFEVGISDAAAPYQITAHEYGLLDHCLARGECTATQLAQVLPVDASRISRTVSRLVDMNILQRRRLRNDRRVVMLSLTENGRNLITELKGRVTAFNIKLIGGVSYEEMMLFRSVAERILANYAALRASGQDAEQATPRRTGPE